MSRCRREVWVRKQRSRVRSQTAKRELSFARPYPEKRVDVKRTAWLRTATLQNDSVFQKRGDWCWLESLSAFEEFQLNQKLRLDQIRTGISDKHRRSGRSSTSREQIIHQHHSLTHCQGVGMHLHLRFTVFQRVLCGVGPVGEFAAFPDRNETKAKFVCHRRSEQKTACINADDLVDVLPAASLQKQIDGCTEQTGVAEHRRDVFKYDAFLWEIGHIAHGSTQFFNDFGGHWRER